MTRRRDDHSCPVGPRISAAQVRALWSDQARNRHEIAAAAGCSYNALKKRAVNLGLPARRSGRVPYIMDTPLFRAMWAAGVIKADMGALLGVSHVSIGKAALRFGLPHRVRITFRGLRLADWAAGLHERAVAQGLQVAGAETRAALRVAEMIDVVTGLRPCADGKRPGRLSKAVALQVVA